MIPPSFLQDLLNRVCDGGVVEVREVEKLEGEILSLEAMRRHYLSMESWSQLVFDDLVAGAQTRVARSPLIVDLDPAP